jgi:hypothetical protein
MSGFQVFVSYSQLSVFDPSLSNPFNDWTSRHVSQGFAWRPGSVSFKTLSESGMCDIEVLSDGNEVPVSPQAIRVIEVPFLVPGSGLIEVASISDGRQIEISPGQYQLRFEACLDSRIRLVFATGKKTRFAVVLVDQGLAPTIPLLETAQPA